MQKQTSCSEPMSNDHVAPHEHEHEHELLSHIEDGELLELYVQSARAPYLEELARRHFSLVCSVANRQLNNQSDVEDAVQTTFLVLTKSAESIRRKQSLSAWLYGVAFRTACRIRRQSKNRAQQHEELHLDEIAVQAESPLSVLAKQFQLEALDEELQGVRDSYRQVLVEHYLLGKSAPEIAHRFNLSQSTVEGRLRRGREQLRTRMLRRGCSFASAVALTALPGKRAVLASDSSMQSFVSILSPAELSQLPSRVTTLAAEEMKMATILAGKYASGTIAAVATLAVVGLLSLSSFGYQTGRMGRGESSLVFSDNQELEEPSAVIQRRYR